MQLLFSVNIFKIDWSAICWFDKESRWQNGNKGPLLYWTWIEDDPYLYKKGKKNNSDASPLFQLGKGGLMLMGSSYKLHIPNRHFNQLSFTSWRFVLERSMTHCRPVKNDSSNSPAGKSTYHHLYIFLSYWTIYTNVLFPSASLLTSMVI